MQRRCLEVVPLNPILLGPTTTRAAEHCSGQVSPCQRSSGVLCLFWFWGIHWCRPSYPVAPRLAWGHVRSHLDLSASHRILQTTMQSFCAPGYTGMRPAHKAVCSTAIITTTCALGEGKCYRFSFPRYLHPHTRARAHHHDLNYIIRSPHYVPVSTRSHPE